MKHLLVVFHSQSGRNQALALALFESACLNVSVETKLMNAFEAQSEDWLWADAFILVCPENFSAISGGMKQFLDRIYYPCLETQQAEGNHAQQQGKPYQLVLASGNGGAQCEQQLQKILKGLLAKPVQDTLFIYGEPKTSDITAMQSLGEAFTEALVIGIF